MKTTMRTILTLFTIAMCITYLSNGQGIIADGQQPQITTCPAGTLVVYGSGNQIFCAASHDNGLTFPDIKLVGQVSGMHLGMSRGPQVASSKDYTLVTAMEKNGTIHIFQLDHKSGKWEKKSMVNDTDGSAPEGLMAIAADQTNNFYVVWLDIRDDKFNKIYFSKSTDQGTRWSKNKMVYRSPDSTVCECCKPNITVTQSTIFIMFRNWLNGSRDMYLTQSDDKGETFGNPEKLGKGTWEINACPMDGGGLVATGQNNITTVWQRKGKIYVAKPGEPEKEIGEGRICSIVSPENPVITWQEREELKLMPLNESGPVTVGKGNFLKASHLNDGKILCVWEENEKIAFKKITPGGE